jgi:anti-sigma regulatory factor (Ser/Thr protein kinase)
MTISPVAAETGARAHRSYLEVAAVPGAVPYARRCTRHTLAAWKLADISADAELVVSELMTNAVTASRGIRATAPVALYLALDGRRLSLLVWDACPALPAQRRRDDDAAGGRGLQIVQALSDRWGTCAIPGRGKVVWARFELTGPPE